MLLWKLWWYVVLAELDKDRTREIKGYAQDLQSMGQPFDINNFTSAGYTEDEVMAAGVMPQGQKNRPHGTTNAR